MKKGVNGVKKENVEVTKFVYEIRKSKKIF